MEFILFLLKGCAMSNIEAKLKYIRDSEASKILEVYI
jgi:hypothetical protein